VPSHTAHASLGLPESTAKTANRSVQPFFAQLTAESRYTMGHPSPSQLPLPIWGSGPPSNTWFPGPSRVHKQISIGSSVFADVHTTPTDRPTDHATRSVTIDRICVSSIAMWSSNNMTSLSITGRRHGCCVRTTRVYGPYCRWSVFTDSVDRHP